MKYVTWIVAIVLGSTLMARDANALAPGFERMKFQEYRLLLRDGHRAYEREDYDAALPLYQRNACMGDKSSQFALGSMYLFGQGTQPDGMKAYAWYVVAAESGKGDYKRARDRVAGLIPAEHKQAAEQLAKTYLDQFGMKATGMYCQDRAEAGTKISQLECKPPIDRITGTIEVKACEN